MVRRIEEMEAAEREAEREQQARPRTPQGYDSIATRIILRNGEHRPPQSPYGFDSIASRVTPQIG